MKRRRHGDPAVSVLRRRLIRNPVKRVDNFNGHAFCLTNNLLRIVAAEVLEPSQIEKILNTKEIKKTESYIP